MIDFNGRRYCVCSPERHLFHPGGTPDFVVEKFKRGFRVSDMTGNIVAFVVSDESPGFVVSARKLGNGRVFYSFSLCDRERSMLNIHTMRCGAMLSHLLTKAFES